MGSVNLDNTELTPRANDVRTSISPEEINKLPLTIFPGKTVVITESAKLPKAVREIEQHEVVGFDTETRPSFKRGQCYNVSLVQIAVPNKVFLIRINHTGLTDEIISLLENSNVIKSGVGIRDDIKALQKLRAFTPGSFHDLSILAKEAGLQVESVKKLTALLLGFRISKSAQTSNWEAPTFTKKQIEYAATDAWVCLELYQKLKRLTSS